MISDPYTAYILDRQPASLDAALVLFDERSKGPDASSPHVVQHEWLERHLCWNEKRKGLLAGFDGFLAETQRFAITVEAALIGGSFVSRKDEPKDIDFLAVYTTLPGFDPEALSEFVVAKRPGLDWRFIPSDAGVLPLLKISMFCHLLYEGRKGGEGSLLLVL
ncbi:hypothetical protein QE361_001893 [Sphingomonas sp. SORGH_AS802]|uniref:DUF6932 family protein n=1 Tax=Sphingomonas sp. SORGH_AS_0802 TaxID=3041800 RepID=UPI0028586863|nr:hypothetical protein [Sphingomonas sp. SORGH_AS_0802]MDR6134910.1 hypothetical protein [Sphingomonas sp. SORGH_AS_0802]